MSTLIDNQDCDGCGDGAVYVARDNGDVTRAACLECAEELGFIKYKTAPS